MSEGEYGCDAGDFTKLVEYYGANDEYILVCVTADNHIIALQAA